MFLFEVACFITLKINQMGKLFSKKGFKIKMASQE